MPSAIRMSGFVTIFEEIFGVGRWGGGGGAVPSATKVEPVEKDAEIAVLLQSDAVNRKAPATRTSPEIVRNKPEWIVSLMEFSSVDFGGRRGGLWSPWRAATE